MKRLLVVCAACMLPCFLVGAQEADNSDRSVELSVIPRLDLSPEFSDGTGNFTLGNTSLYSLFEGNLTDHLSFSIANHWLGFYSVEKDLWAEDTKALYQNTLKRTSNWLDWANLTFSFGDFSLTLGKDMVTTGGIEFDDYDFDVHPILSSSLWNGFDCYQWGGKLGWEPLDGQEFTFQVTTSPYVDDLFGKPWFNYSLGWNGTLADVVETLWSYTAVQTDSKEFHHLVALGQRAELGDFTLGLDLFNTVMNDWGLNYGIAALPSVSYAINDKFDLLVKGGYEYAPKAKEYNWEAALSSSLPAEPLYQESPSHNFLAGAVLNYRPIEDLRLHAAAAYNSLWECASLSLGATYYLRIGK